MIATTAHRMIRIFSQHGINSALLVQLQQLQELALAVTLQGPCRTSVAYHGLDNLVEVSVYRRRSGNGVWVAQRTMAAAMPTRDSDELQSKLAARDLADIIHTLECLLEEGQPS